MTIENCIEGWTGVKWILFTLAAARKMARMTSEIIYLLILDPNSLYSESLRPVNDMSMFRTAGSLTLDETAFAKARDNEQEYIPVARYAVGMSQGMYYTSKPATDKCGTFYYLERESNCLLRFKNLLIAKNKVRAYETLKKINLKRLTGTYSDIERAVAMFEDSDLNLTPLRFYKKYQRKYEKVDQFMEDLLIEERHKDFGEDEERDGLQLSRTFYCARRMELYGLEDKFDQPICELARDVLKYDGIILEHMVGGRQIVTEVLDTRPREESFKNLVYLKREEKK